ncbi:MAG TPA: valine--tRNA ligase [Gaiellaceae bacterium]|nr:valine--tRNA ligase [Gaiellaceae bacterium]
MRRETGMPPRYDPHGVEERWQRTWEEEGLYGADPDPSRTPYVDAHPPPNVTGELHTGHALQLALGDTLVRLKRMQGYNVLFQPGYDHAGISTQSVVEKVLVAEGTSRQELGREAFEARVWEWLHEYGGKILHQFRRMGASLDYRRTRFTMDDDYVRAVMRLFVHLYRRGWIYRANRIINWCPFHETSLSDLELEHVDVDDTLSTIRYPLADGGGFVAIATVRPATIPADVAVAVHPADERYTHLVGREVIVPWTENRVPVIADERVEREFGTGALKITPAHDPNDFAIGRDHGLPEPSCIGLDGRVTAAGLEGLTQQEAAEKVLAWCRERGLLEKREHYRHSVATCERCHSRIEPLISLQWWCAMGELKQRGLDALRTCEVRFHPESQHRFAIDSLENAPDWNISRQIWWGHQIPVWYCPEGHLTVEETEPAACAECGSPDLTRETDVLDTWFSSALWPFATLGWPDETPELAYFYPGDLQTTAREIIRLWENRMIFLGLELLGEVPFRDVIIHSTVLAPDGRRMSKSLGTGVDPLQLIDKYGTDATRYGLMKNSLTQDVRFSYSAIEEGGKLANKLWNAARLILTACEGAAPAERPATLEERWILARLSQTQRRVEALLAEFDFAHTMDELYHLTFDDFCDWYLEAVKARLYDGDADARTTATAALERLLELLHPALPHVTEEIWSHLPGRETRLIVAPWPHAGNEADAGALARVQEYAQVFRRSGVVPKLEGDEKRIFDAVVKPDRAPRRENGNVDAERERLWAEVARAEKMLANERFVANAPPEVVAAEREKLERYRRELDAIGG